MTVSSVDTAELPRVRHQATATPVLTPAPLTVPPAPIVAPPALVVAPPAPVLSPPVPPACRAVLRAERRHQRRQRRLYAFLGLSILGVTLGSTVVVLDVIR